MTVDKWLDNRHWLQGGCLVGFPITAAKLDTETNQFEFELAGVRKFVLRDDQRSCCETRYITCDDPMSNIIGGLITKITCEDGGDRSDNEYERHDVMFVKVETHLGFIALTTHNCHNGYYGGFTLMLHELYEGGAIGCTWRLDNAD
jgi:hypothetical protein